MKRQGLIACAWVAALTVGCNSPSRGDNSVGTAGTAGAYAHSGVSDRDKKFVSSMLSDGTAEIEIATLAKEHASSTDVKQFAQMMIDDHTKAGDQLKGIATANTIPVEPAVDDKHMNLMNDLSKQHGLDFDKAYMSAMVDGHEDAVKALRSRVDEDRTLSERLQGKNPEDRAVVKPESSDDRTTMSVNEWAANTLPTVEHHLDRAKEIKDHLDHMKSSE